MATSIQNSGTAQLFRIPLTPQTSNQTRALFNKVFDESLKPLLRQADHIKKRIDENSYQTCLFFSDAQRTNLAGMYSIDKKPFKCGDLKDAMRVHFLHIASSPEHKKTIFQSAVTHAIEKNAQAILFFVTPKAEQTNTFLGELKFTVLREEKTYNIMVHSKPSELKAQLKTSLQPPIEANTNVTPQPAALPIPNSYKAVTLMRKYLLMIRDGYKSREGMVMKTVEGRINCGMFAAHKIAVGSGMRFFYKQNPNDDVQCTILAVKTFKTFKEMLIHHGYQKLVPDAPNLEAAVQAYVRIPGYTQREQQSGVMSMELRVDGSGVNGPAWQQSQPNTPHPSSQERTSRKRQAEEVSDFGRPSKSYRRDDSGYYGSRDYNYGRGDYKSRY